MKIVLLGAPGAGKGTQARFISQHYHIPHISTGDMLRAAIEQATAIGLQAKTAMNTGQLVSDAIIIALVEERIRQTDCKNGFLFDGFPRTLIQAEAMRQKHIVIDFVIEIAVDEEEIVRRLSGRRIHAGSGRIYHLMGNPPRIANKDDITGEELIQRKDDCEKTVRERLRVYRNQTKPLIEYYQHWQRQGNLEAPRCVRVDGHAAVQQVRKQIIAELSQSPL